MALTLPESDGNRIQYSSYLGGVLQREVDGVEAVEADCDEAVDGGRAEDDIRCDIQLAGPQAGTNLGT